MALFDRYADLVIDVHGEAFDGADSDHLTDVIARHTRRVGPVTVTPDAWVVSGARFLQVPDVEAAAILDTVTALAVDCATPTAIIGRE